ncbi:hypothetical protein LT493_26430 [Streptomyces tricolor]|nr:hypothetical protein [Streptomyces tricolor]
MVDEAHRTSGRIGKPWAVVHDNTRIPALRRLYMTATPRLWQLDEDADQGAPGELVASMEDDPDGPFGARCYTLTLSGGDRPGNLRPLPGRGVDIARHLAPSRPAPRHREPPDQVRGARLAAPPDRSRFKASPRRTSDARSSSTTSSKRPRCSRPASPTSCHGCTPPTRAVPAHHLGRSRCGDHKPGHCRRVLTEFETGRHDGTVVEKNFLGSVKVLGECADTRNCDSVYC